MGVKVLAHAGLFSRPLEEICCSSAVVSVHLAQGHMRRDTRISKSLHGVDQSVAHRINVRVIDPVRVTGEDDLCIIPGPTQNRFTSCGVRFCASSTTMN